MRQNCKHFQSRTYPSGDTVRKCAIDRAPEAPWNCPENCDAFEPRLADVNWRHGSLVVPATPEAPSSVGDDPSIAALLDSAEDIVNAVVPEVRAELEAEAAKRNSFRGRMSRLWPFNR